VLGHRGAAEDPRTNALVRHEAARLPGCEIVHDLDETALFEVLAASDVGIVPSEGYESIPSVVLEMAATGLPVFATYRWGIPEVLPEAFGLTGDLTTDVAKVSAFVEHELAGWDSATWATRYEHHRYDRLAPQYRAVYDELMGTPDG
jgi:glycosyltransferase involved in cell wall biosynthesis